MIDTTDAFQVARWFTAAKADMAATWDAFNPRARAVILNEAEKIVDEIADRIPYDPYSKLR